MVPALGILESKPAVAETKTMAILTIILFNSSEASHGTLVRSEKEVSGIFSKSGVRLAWIDCLPVSGSVRAPLCREESAPGEIRVRIVDRQFKNYLPDGTFGFAVPPVWVTVYYEPALREARRFTDSGSDVSVILGYLIAHEIGHLLLGEKAHAIDGIMTARWEIGQIQQALRRQLKFTPEESKVMLRNAQARTSTIDTSMSEQPGRMTSR